MKTNQSLKQTARVSGILYLIIAVIAPVSMMVVPSTLVVAGDANATAQNILTSEGLFRTGIAGDALIFLIEVVLTVLLYALLKPVNKTLSLMAAFARLAMTIVQGVNVLNSVMVLLVLRGDFPAGQQSSLMMLFLNAHASASIVWGLFFALHLALLGYLVYLSGYIPRILGVVLYIVSLCYFVQNFGMILAPQYETVLSVIGMASMIELAFPVWLVIKGVRSEA